MDVSNTGAAGVQGMTGASGVNGSSGTDGGPGGAGGADAASPTDTTNTAEAAGGVGGNGGNGGNASAPNQGAGRAGDGSSGGFADAAATTTAAGAATSATATAIGGLGGNGGVGGESAVTFPSLSGVGGVGGPATASASDTNTAGTATATATATGGEGGASQYDVNNGAGGYEGNVYSSGNGGVAANTTAYASGTTAATATVTQTGGSGAPGPAGGNGAASTLTNAVSGQTQGGALTLTQTAIGGDGGEGSIYGNGGAGGGATSTLTLTDTSSKMLYVAVRATGGDGGERYASGGAQESAAGGNGVANAMVTGTPSGTMNVLASANGGDGSVAGIGSATAVGTDNGTGTLSVTADSEGGYSPEFGGAANAQATATGRNVYVTASADGGEGGQFGGTGTAQAIGIGASGTAIANAYSSRDEGVGAGGYYDYGPVTSATATVSGDTVATAVVVDGGTLGAFDTTSQAVSTAVLDPSSAAYGSNLPAGDTLLLDTEEGGGSSSTAVGTQTSDAFFSIRLDSASLAPTADLMLDFPSATLVGTGVTGVVFNAEVLGTNNTDLISKTFSSGAQALAYFTNDVIDLGTEADLAGNAYGIGVEFDLKVTTDAPGSGFYIDPVIGSTSPCYCRGTRIRTAHGETPVEALKVGDELVTLSGQVTPIRWIGRRSYAGRFAARNPEAWPIVIKQGALAEGVPCRDLWVSPQHALYLDGVLIPAVALVNGRSVVRATGVQQVDYYHVELDAHEVIWAEGAPAESFLDDDSRGLFQNAPRDTGPAPWAPVRSFAPRVEDGAVLEQVRDRLAARAQADAAFASRRRA